MPSSDPKRDQMFGVVVSHDRAVNVTIPEEKYPSGLQGVNAPSANPCRKLGRTCLP
jgi:hypothetical protein